MRTLLALKIVYSSLVKIFQVTSVIFILHPIVSTFSGRYPSSRPIRIDSFIIYLNLYPVIFTRSDFKFLFLTFLFGFCLTRGSSKSCYSLPDCIYFDLRVFFFFCLLPCLIFIRLFCRSVKKEKKDLWPFPFLTKNFKKF